MLLGGSLRPSRPRGRPSRARGDRAARRRRRARPNPRQSPRRSAGPSERRSNWPAEIVDLASDKKAADIVLLEVRELTTLTDYFVICSGGSERQLGGIADGISEGLKASGMLPIGREGGASAHWLLLDYGSVIVHIMATPEREYYALEKLWAEAPLLLHVL